jgi:choline-sulfatase
MEAAVVEDTLAWLEQRDDRRPFFLWASFLNPHPPLFAPDEFRDLFVDADLPLRGTLTSDEPALPAVDVRRRQEQLLEGLDDEQLLEITRAYYASLAWTDHCIGELLEGLERLGLEGNTLVVYTSDHGELLGQHGLLQKRSFWEPASRVPCLLRWPGHLAAGAVREQVAQHVDLTATVLDLAGVPAPCPPAGVSMQALLADPDAEWDDFAVVELSATPESSAVRRMIRSGRFKYVWQSDREEALFDLESDPGELVNLIGDERHADELTALRARYEAVAERTDWAVPRGR